jgi:hypothetical protein
MTTSRFKGKAAEVIASAAGITGAAWLAAGAPLPVIGWGAFLVSNIAWITVSWSTGMKGLGIQHLAYTATSLYGFVRTG